MTFIFASLLRKGSLLAFGKQIGHFENEPNCWTAAQQQQHE